MHIEHEKITNATFVKDSKINNMNMIDYICRNCLSIMCLKLTLQHKNISSMSRNLILE